MSETPSRSEDPTTDVAKSTSSGWGLLVLVGAALAFASVFVEWATEDLFDESRTARRVPMQFLWDTTPASFDEFPVMWSVLVAVALLVASVMVPKLAWLGVPGGALAVLMPLWYVNGVRSAVDYYDLRDGVGDLVGSGVWLCVAGGLLALAASIARSVRSRSR
ncbi:MAG TPA: hypothetical protein PK020_03200 [Ilumatobacteraceae bacterium]|nr:hypothetical protein [Ilumatobacteraceae bacterium]HRB01863.1 hypothetical protein [Ilumatobacteraceae bacterium]